MWKYENIDESIIFAYENMKPQMFERWLNKTAVEQNRI